MALSTRALELSKPDPGFMLWEIVQTFWDPATNPAGFVNLGLAENTIMHDTLREHIQANFSARNQDFTYGDSKKILRKVLSRFWNEYFQPFVPVEPCHFTITDGCSSALGHLAWSLGNPGDYFLLGRPYYYTFIADITYRMSTVLQVVDFENRGPFSTDERQIIESMAQNCRYYLNKPSQSLGTMLFSPVQD